MKSKEKRLRVFLPFQKVYLSPPSSAVYYKDTTTALGGGFFMCEGRIREVERPDRILSYFGQEKAVLLVVTVTGILYNLGMGAGPYFEGQLAQCLYDIFQGKATAGDMVRLAALYVGVIFLVQLSRAGKRYSVRLFSNRVSRTMRHTLYHSLVRLEARHLPNRLCRRCRKNWSRPAVPCRKKKTN